MRRQHAMVWLGALLLACAAALAACADDLPEAPPSAASVERVDNSATDAQQAQAEQAEQQDAPASEPAPRPTSMLAGMLSDSLAEIAALSGDWSAQLTSIELEMDVAIAADDFTLDQAVVMQIRLDPLELYAQIEIQDLLSELFEGVAGEGVDQEAVDQTALEQVLDTTIRFLLVDERAYFSLGGEGWVEVPAAELFGSDLASLTGGFSDDAAAALAAQADAALLCAELTDGSLAEGEFDGAPVWIVSCDVDLEAMAAMLEALESLGQSPAAVPGLPDDEALAQLESLSYTVQIDQRSGALLAFNVAMSLNDETTGAMTVSTTGRTTSWNQPIELPTPTPLIEEDGATTYE